MMRPAESTSVITSVAILFLQETPAKGSKPHSGMHVNLKETVILKNVNVVRDAANLPNPLICAILFLSLVQETKDEFIPIQKGETGR